MTDIIASPRFNGLDSGRQHTALMIAGVIALQLQRPDEAYALLLRSTAMPEASELDWGALLEASRQLHKSRDAALALVQLAKRWPDQLSALDDRLVAAVARGVLAPEEGDVRFELLDALHTADWKLHDGSEPAPLWRDLTLLYIERNELERAGEVEARITEPQLLLSIRVDKRFDVLRQRNPQKFDIDEAVRREIERREAAVERSPRLLLATARLVTSLLSAGRYQDALSITERVMDTLESADPAAPPYDDMEVANWILNYRATALRGIERWDEAERELRNAAYQPENGRRNVSNMINLAAFYLEAGRADTALETLVDVGPDMSGYGLMQLHSMRHAAALMEDKQTIAAESFTYLQDHQSDAMTTWQQALVRADRLDEAAAVLIARLRDPSQRNRALTDVQEYADPPLSGQLAIWHAKWQQVIARDDVRREIETYGRREKFSIRSDY